MAKRQLWMTEPDRFSPSAMDRLHEHFNVITGVPADRLDADGLDIRMQETDVLWIRLAHKITKDMIQNLGEGAAVVCPATGTDHVEVRACEKYGVSLLCLKDEQKFLKKVRATSELSIGLMIALMRKIHLSNQHVKKGGWNRDLFQGTELFEKTLGIVGLGRLGRIVAEYGRAFGMDVIYYDPYVQDGDFRKVSKLEELARESDIASIHVKLNEETAGLISDDFFNAMRPHSVFINTSRGGIVDERALLSALENQRLAGAALDVLSGEPDVDGTHPVIKYANENANILLTPHIGGNTVESFEKTEHYMVDKLLEHYQLE